MSQRDKDSPGLQLSVQAEPPATTNDASTQLPVKAGTGLTILRHSGLSRARYADILL